jgi:hypothetical protein
MAERNVRFNPTHEMQKAMQYMDFVFYGGK